MKLVVALVMVLAIFGLWRYNEHLSDKSERAAIAAQQHKPFQPVGAAPRRIASVPVTSQAPSQLFPQAVPKAAPFECDGRKHCSEMRSCSEAKSFLQHCPGTVMDGDNDGIPCEQQWCNT